MFDLSGKKKILVIFISKTENACGNIFLFNENLVCLF